MERLVLFDVDGTLMDSGGAGRRSIRLALLEVFGTAVPLGSYTFCGKTDSKIVLELTEASGLDVDFVQQHLIEVFEAYVCHLRIEMARRPVGLKLYPGVEDLLELLSGIDTVTLGLLTGNVQEGAKIKLEAFNLNRYFVVGAFGDDSVNRDDLPEIVMSRAKQDLGKSFDGSELVIVGDTPHDINCGRHVGARSIAVATGMISLEELERERPDHLFPDFADYRKVVEAIVA